jgi:phenylacetate-CoA ligase
MTNLFATLKILGFPIKKASQILHSIPDGDDFRDWHAQKKWEAFKFHYEKNDAYRNFVGKRPSEWEEIPILRKIDFFNAHISLKPDKDRNKRYYRQSTSGSTGIPFTFFSDYLTHALTWAYIEKVYRHANASLNGLQARFYGSPSTLPDKLKENMKDLLAGRERFQVINLSGENLDEWIKRMKSRKFSYLYGYAFPLIVFAKHLNAKGILLRDIVPSLNSCIITSEMCTNEEQDLMEKSFGVKVYNEYGTSEFGVIGFGDTGKWKVSEETLHVEIVDEAGNSLEDGEVGRVVCTQLFQQGTPFVRYEVGDLAALKTIDGKRYITQLQGRKEAMLKLPSGKRMPGDTLFHFVMEEFNRKFPNLIYQFQAIQKDDFSIAMKLISGHPLSEIQEESLKKTITRHAKEEINIDIQRVSDIPGDGRTKRQRFISCE